MSWLFIILAFSPMLVLVLHPTLKEFFILVGLDFVAGLINSIYEDKIFLKLFPTCRSFFHGIDHSNFLNLSLVQKTEMIESMIGFPRKRAWYFYIGSFIKGIPALVYVTFGWHHSVSHLEQFLMMIGITSINFCFGYASIYIESQIYLSEKIRELHQKFDLTEVFKAVKIPAAINEVFRQEAFSILFIVLFMVGLQSLMIFSGQYNSPAKLAISLCAVNIIGVVLFFRIWILGRTYFVHGIRSIFNQVDQLDLGLDNKSLPLSSSPLLAHFEKIYNSMRERIIDKEKQLNELALLQAERSRYQALGEISALIAHDLSAPLNTANFCATELSEHREHPKKEKYLSHLKSSIDQTIFLISSLKARLKNQKYQQTRAKFSEAINHVTKLMAIQFDDYGYNTVKIQVSPELMNSEIDMASSDLIHIFDNLFRNSLENLLKNAVKEPTIELSLYEKNDKTVKILFSDNGTGLSQGDFDKMTSSSGPSIVSTSLGLKLIRRFVENYNGKLVLFSSAKLSGTTFLLELKLSPHEVFENAIEQNYMGT